MLELNMIGIGDETGSRWAEGTETRVETNNGDTHGVVDTVGAPHRSKVTEDQR
jgi:hypothetical protein